jgi:hypothetical protein
MSDAEDDLEIAIAERDKAEAERDALRAQVVRLQQERDGFMSQLAEARIQVERLEKQ